MAPRVSRMHLPPEYGAERGGSKGLLTWDAISARIAQAAHYWICTVDGSAHPHATPVDGLWIDDRLYFGGSPRTRRQRNLLANPSACVHLESASDVVIIHGETSLERPDHALAVRLAERSLAKYGYGQSPADYEKTEISVLRPRMAFAWTNLPKDATRFEWGG